MFDSKLMLALCFLGVTLSPSALAKTYTGQASYYGKKFQGRSTASGERFNYHKLTAAHPSLPFGTKVKVTNLRTRKSVIVRINDRGPFKKSRIIDLSRGAFSKIASIGTGTIRVKLEVIGKAISKRTLKKEVKNLNVENLLALPGHLN